MNNGRDRGVGDVGNKGDNGSEDVGNKGDRRVWMWVI